jgi:hypothetical protein
LTTDGRRGLGEEKLQEFFRAAATRESKLSLMYFGLRGILIDRAAWLKAWFDGFSGLHW